MNITSYFLQYGALGLFLVSFAESSFFPVPPDVLLIPLAIKNPSSALLLALITTVASVAGAVFGYFIGWRAGRPVLDRFVSGARIHKVEEMFGKYGGWAVAISAFTPIPFKVFTIASGVFKVNKNTFLLASLLGRGARFFLEGLIIMLLGRAAEQFLNKYLGAGTLVVAAVVLLIYLLYKVRHQGVPAGGIFAVWTKKIELLIEKKLSPLGEFGTYLVSGSILAAMSLLIFAKLAEDLIFNELRLFDTVVTNFITGLSSPALTETMKLITNFGSAGVLAIIALLVVFILIRQKKHYWDSAMVVISLLGGWLLNEALKMIFQRPRPELTPLVEVSGYSFPSGHTMTSAAFYGFLAFLTWLYLRHSRFRVLVVAGLTLLVVLIGISRIYLGAHYPSDVLAGWAGGGFWLAGCILALQTIRYKKQYY
ncbi:phosphoesterase PA-phosphatase-like protein [Thermincola ferriacetica]|uniref:Phosphoesterase PA-phosphatase-like protein n=1 Tax=Thermincola ferriacetica TaxID=281456 RepID=A0A0L6W147_9FIRM|nr:phosphatase PAP2 family protein [Thermincola ferriacetica]KNZ69103.1 phosphoesterase PA-phosphatase-like protein [Thermincola ferriacetica]